MDVRRDWFEVNQKENAIDISRITVRRKEDTDDSDNVNSRGKQHRRITARRKGRPTTSHNTCPIPPLVCPLSLSRSLSVSPSASLFLSSPSSLSRFLLHLHLHLFSLSLSSYIFIFFSFGRSFHSFTTTPPLFLPFSLHHYYYFHPPDPSVPHI